MISLLLRLNNRFPRTIGALLALSDGRAFDAVALKLYELAAPVWPRVRGPQAHTAEGISPGSPEVPPGDITWH